VQRNRIIAALAATLALTACTPDAGERVTGPGRPGYDHKPIVPRPAPIGDSVVVQAVEGGNAFGSGT
jgi:hypothetical protein